MAKLQGFIQREGGGGTGVPPLPPRNLEIEYGYYCGGINTSYLINFERACATRVKVVVLCVCVCPPHFLYSAFSRF